MKKNRINSIANNLLRDVIRTESGFLYDPFSEIRPKQEIKINLLKNKIFPIQGKDSVSEFYLALCDWFRNASSKEGINLKKIDKAKLYINSKHKKVVISYDGEEISLTDKF